MIVAYGIALAVIGWLGWNKTVKVVEPVPVETVYHVITLQGMQTQTVTCQTLEERGKQ